MCVYSDSKTIAFYISKASLQDKTHYRSFTYLNLFTQPRQPDVTLCNYTFLHGEPACRLENIFQFCAILYLIPSVKSFLCSGLTFMLHMSNIVSNLTFSGERVAHLLCVVKENATLLAVQFQAEKIVQTLWSRPPVEGARVVTTVLSNPAHMVEW